jgi:hypothetical protein
LVFRIFFSYLIFFYVQLVFASIGWMFYDL